MSGPRNQMRARSHAVSTAMAAVFFAVCFLFACASKPLSSPGERTRAALLELRKATRDAIPDDVRAHEVSRLIDALEIEDRNARDAVAGYRERLRALDANYDTTEADFEKLFVEFNTERRAQ